jgi:hypothetical protein
MNARMLLSLPRAPRRAFIGGLIAAFFCLLAPSAQAGFGIESGSVSIEAINSDGTIDTQAGSHPFALNIHFKLNTEPNGFTQGGELRDAIIDLPPGLIGNPRAIATCSQQDFEGQLPFCPVETQVGLVRAILPDFGQEAYVPLYNVAAPPGFATKLAFVANGLASLQYATVRTEDGYGIRISATKAPTEASEVTATVWGNPADSGHDDLRGCISSNGTPANTLEHCSSPAPQRAYLTLPAKCGEPLSVTVKVNSKEDPGTYSEETAQAVDQVGNPAPLTGCDAVPFTPAISAQPTTKLDTNPSGLDFELKLPNQGLLSPGGTSETEPRKAVVTLPEGMTVNPSFAEGIVGCSEQQYKAEQIDTGAGEGCPNASKLGSLIVQTPLLEEPVEGSLYLAEPYANRFGTLAALYMVARAPERGVLVKQAGKVELDQATGQITTTFDDLPPLPFSSFKLHFREGARSPLVTPKACGEYQATARFTPHSAPDDSGAIATTGSFQIERGPDGGACPSGGLPPFRPGLVAKTLNAGAGQFSPFYLDLSRADTEQEITHFSIKLPPGLVGKLAGVPFCSEAQIAQAKSRERVPGAGQAELDSPSCPAASEVGNTLAGAGVGPSLAYAPGKLYLAGPYHGSAISVVAITAAKVGPFDLGTVVIRQALRVNPETGEVFVDATGSDPIPHIVSGVPVHAREIRAYVDRPDFTLNPTNCKQTSTASTLLGSGLDFASEADDRPVTVSSPFQVVNCAKLPFKPRLSLKLKGGTHRGDYPALTASLKMNGFGEAGIRRAQVTLPPSEFIANAHFNTICTRVQFKQGAHPGELCPPGSIYGKATAVTPILSEPLTGPVFLRSSEHQLPDVVASLHNGEIDVVLVGRVDSVKGKLRNTFEATPDAPVSSVVVSLRGGKKGLFENSTNLCKGTHRALASFTGHNGKQWDKKPELIALGCKGRGRRR